MNQQSRCRSLSCFPNLSAELDQVSLVLDPNYMQKHHGWKSNEGLTAGVLEQYRHSNLSPYERVNIFSMTLNQGRILSIVFSRYRFRPKQSSFPLKKVVNLMPYLQYIHVCILFSRFMPQYDHISMSDKKASTPHVILTERDHKQRCFSELHQVKIQNT